MINDRIVSVSLFARRLSSRRAGAGGALHTPAAMYGMILVQYLVPGTSTTGTV